MPIDNEGRILVVDDSGAVRSIVRKLLSELSYANVDEASDGTAALEKMNEKPYSLVISDWNMAPMNGKALLDRVFSIQKLKTTPFIMMTTESDQYKIIAAKYPIDIQFINKPFSTETLQTKISKITAE